MGKQTDKSAEQLAAEAEAKLAEETAAKEAEEKAVKEAAEAEAKAKEEAAAKELAEAEAKAKEEQEAKAVETELKTVTVVRSFRDKNDHKTWYSVGSVQEFEASRAQDIVTRGFAKFSEV
jgi:membrane protein involved in colicin uptake